MVVAARLIAGVTLLVAITAGSGSRAEIVIQESAGKEVEYYAHPALRSLVFVSPTARAQAILPPAPAYVPPPPLIWRAPGITPLAPPPAIVFTRPGAPSNRDLAAYGVARAHAFSQDLYRRNGVGSGNVWWYGPVNGGWLWLGAPTAGLWLTPAYPPPAPGASHPSNRDNAAYLIDRAHRFSQDAYRRP